MVRIFLIILILCGPLFLGSCATAYNPATGKNELIFITTPVEVSIGKALSARITNDFKISSDKRLIDRVKGIGLKIAAVSDRKDIEYRFFVIEDDALNAFTIPGGYVYVNSGLLKKANDGELACVIGHEIGHVAARHAAKKLQAQLGYDILMNIATKKAGIGEFEKAISLSYNLILLGYSRKDELLADRLGVKYAWRAGYDPYAMVSFLNKIAKTNKEEVGFVFLRSHPYTSQRIEMLNKEIPAIIKRERNKGGAQRITHNNRGRDYQIKTSYTGEKKKSPLKVMCPKCRRIYPGSVNYCPYDGTRLK